MLAFGCMSAHHLPHFPAPPNGALHSSRPSAAAHPRRRPAPAERLRAKAAAVSAESSEAAALQKQLVQQERELARQAAQLAKEAAEVDVRARESSKHLGQVGAAASVGRQTQHPAGAASCAGACSCLCLLLLPVPFSLPLRVAGYSPPRSLQAEATQAVLERRAEELNAAEVRVRKLQVCSMPGCRLSDSRWTAGSRRQLFCSSHRRLLSSNDAAAAFPPRPPPPAAAQVHVEQQMRALEGREAELRTIEVSWRGSCRCGRRAGTAPFLVPMPRCWLVRPLAHTHAPMPCTCCCRSSLRRCTGGSSWQQKRSGACSSSRAS